MRLHPAYVIRLHLYAATEVCMSLTCADLNLTLGRDSWYECRSTGRLEYNQSRTSTVNAWRAFNYKRAMRLVADRREQVGIQRQRRLAHALCGAQRCLTAAVALACSAGRHCCAGCTVPRTICHRHHPESIKCRERERTSKVLP